MHKIIPYVAMLPILNSAAFASMLLVEKFKNKNVNNDIFGLSASILALTIMYFVLFAKNNKYFIVPYFLVLILTITLGSIIIDRKTSSSESSIMIFAEASLSIAVSTVGIFGIAMMYFKYKQTSVSFGKRRN
jgi:hypothetical protein